MFCALDTGAIWLVDTQSHLHLVLPENKSAGLRRVGKQDIPHGKMWIWGARPQPFKDSVTDRSFLALVEPWDEWKKARVTVRISQTL